MLFAPSQRFPAIAEYFDFELIAFRTRDRDRVFAIVRSDHHFKTCRSVDGSIRGRVSFNEFPNEHRDEDLAKSLRKIKFNHIFSDLPDT